MVFVCCCISVSFSLMNSVTKVGEPTGMPRRRKPSVSSTGVVCCGFCLLRLLEYRVMAVVMSLARAGLCWWISGIGELPDVEVSIRVFSVLMMHPSGIPSVSNCWQRKRRSSSGTTVEMSSMKARRLVIPPCPSSWALPLARRAAALIFRALSIGWSSCDATSAPRIGDSGHPCVDPSTIRRECHSLSLYL